MQRALSERARISLQIRAVEIAYRDPTMTDDPQRAVALRERARRLLDPLHVAARPFPDLQARLAEAWTRLEL
jgi:hypothetical protein